MVWSIDIKYKWFLNRFIWTIDWTLLDTPGLHWSGSNSNEKSNPNSPFWELGPHLQIQFSDNHTTPLFLVGWGFSIKLLIKVNIPINKQKKNNTKTKPNTKTKSKQLLLRVIILNTNNLHTGRWYQVFLSNTNNSETVLFYS